MTIGSIIYRLLIGPLELFFEVVFVIANRLVENPAYAIIILSLAMNILVLPLYRRADELQAEERDKEAALRPWLTHIKKTFSGDERFMMQQAFYRQNNYKPTDTLKGSISLLLEIPFFIAAYHFLSHLSTLRGVSFGPISDLGAPDALIGIGGMTINFLPILMTLINVISAAIYMKGFPLKSKIQMYGIAAIFLIFLYNSPAGLVFYWTLNNIFSLCKNIFYKIKNPAKVLRIMLSVLGVLLILGLYFVHPMRSLRSQAIMTMILLTMQVPMLSHLFKKTGKEIRLPEQKYTKPVFWFSCGVLTVLTGLLIPSAIIHGSAAEFINFMAYSSPLWYIVSAFVIAAGTFLVWFGIFFNLAGDGGKQMMSLLVAMAAVGAVVDYMFFGKTFGNISPDLIYDVTPHVTRQMILVNFAALAVVAAVVLLLYVKKRALINILLAVSCIALIGMAGMNVMGIQKELKENDAIIAAAMDAEPSITLSKEGNNVIVIMMDRQIGHLVPFLVHENPELKKQFDGFVLYPNSVSFGSKTNFGAPALYGGYDYTMEKMNERDTESLESKHNEALKVMPEVFGSAGYDVTICEPSYAGYTWIPDLTIFDDHPEYHCFLANQRFSLEEYGFGSDPFAAQKKRMRNFFCFSLFRVSPGIFQTTLYESGGYNAPKETVEGADGVTEMFPQVTDGPSKATGYRESFMRTYAVLCHLGDITTVEDKGTNTFFMMSNDTTHDPMMLAEPAYEPALTVDNTAFDAAHPYREDDEGNQLLTQDEMTLIHYQCNMAAMVQLGKWFDYLKEQGVWDNTRIIIVSDHGQDMFPDRSETDAAYTLTYTSEADGEVYRKDMMAFNSVLLYKDFDSTGFTIDDQLTTNADTPALATRDLIPDAANPFTGTRFTTYQENPVELNLLYSMKWDVTENNGNRFLEAEWFRVHDNIFDINNWTYEGWH